MLQTMTQFYGTARWKDLCDLSVALCDFPSRLAEDQLCGLVYQRVSRENTASEDVPAHVVFDREQEVLWHGFGEPASGYFRWFTRDDAVLAAQRLRPTGSWHIEYVGPADTLVHRLAVTATEAI